MYNFTKSKKIMKKAKMSFSSLTGKLTRNEMRYVLAGSGNPAGTKPPYGYWDYNTSNQTGSTGGMIAQTAWNVGIAVVNGAAWVGNQIAKI
jgi:hypothetical protein